MCGSVRAHFQIRWIHGLECVSSKTSVLLWSASCNSLGMTVFEQAVWDVEHLTLQVVVLTFGHAALQVTSVVCYGWVLPTFFLFITFLSKWVSFEMAIRNFTELPMHRREGLLTASRFRWETGFVHRLVIKVWITNKVPESLQFSNGEFFMWLVVAAKKAKKLKEREWVPLIYLSDSVLGYWTCWCHGSWWWRVLKKHHHNFGFPLGLSFLPDTTRTRMIRSLSIEVPDPTSTSSPLRGSPLHRVFLHPRLKGWHGKVCH